MPTLTERLNAAVKAFQSKPREGEAAFADPFRLYPGRAFMPYNPSSLVGKKGLSVFDLMRNDDQIKAALSFKKGAIISTGYEVVSPEGQPMDWDPTRYVRWVFAELAGPVEDKVWEILSALDYGFSVSELIWRQVTDGEWAGLVQIVDIKTRRPHEFDFDRDEFGNILPDGVLQRQPSGQKRLPKEKFVLFQNEGEFQNPYGRSDLEAAYRPWWSKDNAYKWLTMLLERLGIPPVFGLYDPGKYSPAQIDELKKVVQNLQAASFGIIPKAGADSLDFWHPELAGQATRVFLPAIQEFNVSIARAILMPGLLGLTSETSFGSFARARVSFDVFLLIIEKLRRSIQERVIMDQVVRPLVDVNFGGGPYPMWRWLPVTDEVRLDIFNSWIGAVESGVLPKFAADEKFARAMLRLPEVAEDEEPIPVERPGGNGGFPGLGHWGHRGGHGGHGGPGENDGFSGGGFPPLKPVLGLSEGTLPKVYRQPNAFEREVDFAQIGRGLDRLEEGAAKELRRALEQTRDALAEYVDRFFGRMGPEFVDSLQITNLPDIKEILRRFVHDAYDFGGQTIRRELPKRFQETGPSFIPVEALRWLAQKAGVISGTLRDRLLAETKQILLNALKFGEPQRETIQKLRAAFEPYVGDPDLAIEDFLLENIIRTNATEAFNQGRLVAARDPDVAGLIRGMEYSAVIDDRTTPVCRFLDGKIFPMSEPELDRLAPPNHYQCRSILVPVTIGMTFDESKLITPSEIGRAEELAQEGFK